MGDEGLIMACVQHFLRQDRGVSVLVGNPADPLWAFLPRQVRRIVPDEMDACVSDTVIIGADVFDGNYAVEDVARLVRIARFVVARGFACRLVSVSVKRDVGDGVLSLWRQIPRECPIAARDTDSCARLRAALPLHSVVLSADITFLLETPPAYRESGPVIRLAQRRSEFGSVHFVNANAHVPASAKIIDDATDHLLANGAGFVYFAVNDLRRSVGDLEAAAAWKARFAGSARIDAFIPGNYFEVKAASAFVDSALVARMHVAIALLAAGKAPYFLDYNDKGGGLFSLFGLDDHCLNPEAGNPDFVQVFAESADPARPDGLAMAVALARNAF